MSVAKGRSLSFAERVDPESTALIIIDVQNDFCLPGYAVGKLGESLDAMPPMLKALGGLLKAGRDCGVFIVHVRASYDDVAISPPLAEQYGRRRYFDGLCLEGSAGIEFVDLVRPREGDNETVITKHRYSAWWGTELDILLRANGIKSVVVCGVVTEGCVESTARDAFFNDYYVVAAMDCCASISQGRHEGAVDNIQRFFGRSVPAAQIISAWTAAPVGRRGWQSETKASRLLAGLHERLAPARTAVVLVNLQNDLCHQRGIAAKLGQTTGLINGALPHVRTLLASARHAGCMVIHLKAQYDGSARNVGAPQPMRTESHGVVWTASAAVDALVPIADFCAPGSWGAEFVDGLVPIGNELVVIKHRFSGFVGTRLELLLRSNDIRSVVIAGVTTNSDIESTARDACMRDFYVVIAQDAVATADQDKHLHDASLETMRSHFARVEPSSRIAASWSSQETNAA